MRRLTVLDYKKVNDVWKFISESKTKLITNNEYIKLTSDKEEIESKGGYTIPCRTEFGEVLIKVIGNNKTILHISYE